MARLQARQLGGLAIVVVAGAAVFVIGPTPPLVSSRRLSFC
jgi:hypothetical protein